MNLTWKNGILLLLGVVAASALGCFLALQFLHEGDDEAGHQKIHEHAHEIFQRDLGLTTEQMTALEEIEQTFRQRQTDLRTANATAVAMLADALERDRAYSPAVDAAISEIHQRQGDLQKATIDHILDSKSVLTDEQFDRLLKMVADALRGEPDDS